MLKGIDVSKWNGSIDFSKVREAGYDFVIIRAGYGKDSRQIDPLFERNYLLAKNAGLSVGAYWYSYAITPEDAKREADTFLETVKGKRFDFPLYMDVEEKKQFSLGRDLLGLVISDFLTTLENAGYFAGLYMSKSPLTQYLPQDIGERFSLWVAQYNIKCTYKGPFGIWQKSSRGNVPGVTGHVDIDISYVDFPKVIKTHHLNGY